MRVRFLYSFRTFHLPINLIDYCYHNREVSLCPVPVRKSICPAGREGIFFLLLRARSAVLQRLLPRGRDAAACVCQSTRPVFYYAMTYLVTQAVNAVENLRYTIRDGSVYLLDKRTPSFTELKRAANSSRSSRARVRALWTTSAGPRRIGARHRRRSWKRPPRRTI